MLLRVWGLQTELAMMKQVAVRSCIKSIIVSQMGHSLSSEGGQKGGLETQRGQSEGIQATA